MSALTPVDGLLIRVALYLAVFWPTVGYYVYVDSSRRELSRPRARAVALGALGVVGVLVHLGTRTD